MKIRKNISSVSKNAVKKEGKRHVLIKDFNTFMYDYTLNYKRKHFLLLFTSF